MIDRIIRKIVRTKFRKLLLSKPAIAASIASALTWAAMTFDIPCLSQIAALFVI